MSSRLKDMFIRHEGLKNKPYLCSEGFLTIGVGRNLDSVGLSEDESLYLLDNDIRRSTAAAIQVVPEFLSLTSARQDVIISMIFNLGIGGFLAFKKVIEAIKIADYAKAADEMLESKWAQQVGLRAKELSELMRSGTYAAH